MCREKELNEMNGSTFKPAFNVAKVWVFIQTASTLLYQIICYTLKTHGNQIRHCLCSYSAHIRWWQGETAILQEPVFFFFNFLLVFYFFVERGSSELGTRKAQCNSLKFLELRTCSPTTYLFIRNNLVSLLFYWCEFLFEYVKN